jgi:hypothetical protein
MQRRLVTKIALHLRLAILAMLLSPGYGLVAGCGKSDPHDPEGQIRAVIAMAEEAAQQRDIGTLKDFVADGYKDKRGYEKRSVVRLVQGYLLRHRNIHLLSKITDLEINEPARASTSLLVAMTGRRIESAEQLWDLRADVFQFDLSWIQSDGEWQVANATWRRVRIDDFFSD